MTIFFYMIASKYFTYIRQLNLLIDCVQRLIQSNYHKLSNGCDIFSRVTLKTELFTRKPYHTVWSGILSYSSDTIGKDSGEPASLFRLKKGDSTRLQSLRVSYHPHME